MIGVTGTSGHLGRMVVEELLARGVAAGEIAALARTTGKLTDLAERGVSVRTADYDRPETLDAALKDVKTLLLVSSPDPVGRVPQHEAVIRAAVAAGVQLLVYTSALKADTAQSELVRGHRDTENLIRASTLPFIILRNGLYLENYTATLSSAIEHGAIMDSAGDGRISGAARADFAAAAAIVLTQPQELNTIIELGGDQSFTMQELADEVSRQSGKAITYVRLSAADFVAALVGVGVPLAFAQILADMGLGIARGEQVIDTHALSRLIGRPTTSLSTAISTALGTTRQLKAYGFSQYGGPENQTFLKLPMPTPKADELLIEVRAAGVNPVDWKIREGYMREYIPLELPATLGQEVSGVVSALGPDVTGFKIGDEVFGSPAPGFGGYAQYTLTTVATTALKPASVSFTDAAVLPVAAATAYDGVIQLHLQPGQTLLINGASGGVGIAAIQLALGLGLTVIGTASADKQQLIKSLGATAVIYGDGVADRIRTIEPNGVDAILDLAGGESLRAVADLLTDRNTLITAADPATASQLGGQMIARDRTSRVLNIVAAMVANGQLDPHVKQIFDLDHAADALAAVEVTHATGKVVITVQ